MELAIHHVLGSAQLPLLDTFKEEMRFQKFDRAHPEIYTELLARTLEMQACGFKRYAIRTLWEILRWSRDRKPTGEKPFALNDHFPPFYARKIMQQNPSLRGFFEIREKSKP